MAFSQPSTVPSSQPTELVAPQRFLYLDFRARLIRPRATKHETKSPAFGVSIDAAQSHEQAIDAVFMTIMLPLLFGTTVVISLSLLPYAT